MYNMPRIGKKKKEDGKEGGEKILLAIVSHVFQPAIKQAHRRNKQNKEGRKRMKKKKEETKQ